MTTTTNALPARPTIKQAAAYANVDPTTIRRWVASSRLVAYRVGPRLIRVDRDSLLAMLKPIGGAA